MNRRPGEHCIHVEFTAEEIPDLLEDLYESCLGRNPATEKLRLILEGAATAFEKVDHQ